MSNSNVIDLAKLSDAVYYLNDAAKFNASMPTGWVMLDSRSSEVGYNGAVFQNQATGETVLVSKGTDLHIGDLASDAQMIARSLPSEYASAKEFYTEATAKYGNNIDVAGHSLGGSISQLLAVDTGATAYTFNPYGTANIINGNAELKSKLEQNGASNVNNYMINGDPVSGPFYGSSQIGNNTIYGSDKVTTDLIDMSTWNSSSLATLIMPSTVGVAITVQGFLLAKLHGIGDVINALENNVVSSSSFNYNLMLDYFNSVLSKLSVYSMLSNIIMNSAMWQYDPLALDLNGDGVRTISARS